MTRTSLACPRCRGTLDEDQWRCLRCASTFRSLRGIPDLRVTEDGFLANEEDWAYALRLDADYDRLYFRGLPERYFDLSAEAIPPDLRRRQVAHIVSAPGRSRQ